MTSVVLRSLVFVTLFAPAMLLAQASKIAVIDFERAVVESTEGKKAAEAFNVKAEEKRKVLESLQSQLEQAQERLRTGERTLSDNAKASLTRDIERLQTDLTRNSQDAERDLGTLREQLLAPLADTASRLLTAWSAEQGFTMLVDISNPQSNVIYFQQAADVTENFVKRLDAEFAKTPPATAPAAAPAAPSTPAPAPPAR